MADWAMPLAGIDSRPTHMSAEAYYSISEENLRSYPVYMPELEPEGYWQRMLATKPEPLIELDTLKTQADWIAAGERFFHDSVVLRTFDPEVIAMARDQTAWRHAARDRFPTARSTRCHTPPLYTNNRLTPAESFTPPADANPDVMSISVGMDPGLALLTRKGTGYYKVPSLKGLWYRGHYLHDRSVGSLEEMFDPDRLSDTHEPGGLTPPGSAIRAIRGHEFGLTITAEERAQLIAFLLTL